MLRSFEGRSPAGRAKISARVVSHWHQARDAKGPYRNRLQTKLHVMSEVPVTGNA